VIYLASSQRLETLTAKGDVKFTGVENVLELGARHLTAFPTWDGAAEPADLPFIICDSVPPRRRFFTFFLFSSLFSSYSYSTSTFAVVSEGGV
jgi:hypothetical protein